MFDHASATTITEPRPLGPVVDRLDEMPPGPFLGNVLARIDVGDLSASDRVTVMRAHDRMVSHHQAQRYAAMAAIADAYEELEGGSSLSWTAGDGAATEVRAALHLTRRAADAEMAMASDLRHRLRAVWEAMLGGYLDVRRARVVVEATGHLPEADAGVVALRCWTTRPRRLPGSCGH